MVRLGIIASCACALALAVFIALQLSCTMDPVHAAAVRDLGDEDPEVPVGPYHRAGQPCTVCHGEKGPAKSAFLVAGTVFATADAAAPLPGAEVRVRDATQGDVCVVTNCRGNFWISNDAYPGGFTFPYKVSVRKGSTKGMLSLVGREGSCGTCHRARAAIDAELQVHMFDVRPPLDPLCDVNTPAHVETCTP